MDTNKKRHLLVEALLDDKVEERLGLMVDSGLMAEIVPEFLDLRMEDGNGRHKDNLAHTIKVVAKCPQSRRVRLAAFFHDIGKPATRKFVDGKVTFHGHEYVGARMTEKIMDRLGFGGKMIADVALIVEMSGRVRGADDWTDSAVRRFVSDADDVLDDLLTFCFNDTTSKYAKKRKVVENQVKFLRGRIREVAKKDEDAAKRPPFNGYQVMEMYNVPQGRALGMLMKAQSVDMTEAEARTAMDQVAGKLGL